MCVFPCHSHSPIPPTGTIVSPYPIKTIAKTGIQTCARACLCVRACVRKHTHPYTHIYGRMHTNILTHTHTLGRERVISKSILLKKKSEKRMRASKPQPVLADCKGLSVTAVFYWAKGKQQDSTWGPVKGYSSWKSALAHGLECGLRLIS